MTRPIVGFLAEFTPVARPADLSRDEAAEGARADAERVATLVEAARAEAFAEGRRQAEAEGAEQRRLLTHRHAAEIAEARSATTTAEGATLAERLRHGLEALETSLAESLAGAAGAFIAPAVRARTQDELRQALAELMAGAHGAVATVKGPADLVDALRTAWGENTAVVFVVSDNDEVVVEAGETTITTQMQAWSDRFQLAFGGAA